MAESPDAPKPSSQKQPRYLGLIHVDLSALVAGRVGDGEFGEIAGLGTVPVAAVRDLLGDSILKLVITNGAGVANVTHLGRGPSAAQKTALLWTDRTCTVAGCNRIRRLQADHRLDHQYTKHTRLDGLDRLCDYDHDLKTHKGWALVDGVGKRRMVRSGHPDHPGDPQKLTFEKYPENATDPYATAPTNADAGEPTGEPPPIPSPRAVPQHLLERIIAIKQTIAAGDLRAAGADNGSDSAGGPAGPTIDDFRRWYPKEPAKEHP